MQIPDVLALLMGAGTLTAAATAPLLVRARRTAATLERRLADTEADAGHLAETRLPALVDQLSHPHLPVPGPRRAAAAGSPVEAAQQRVLQLTTTAVRAAEERADAAGQAVLRAVTADTQALSYRMQDLLTELQETCDDGAVLKQTIELDQLNERVRRRWQGIGIACGASPRLVRANSHLPDLVVGAQSRIEGYERISLTNHLRTDRPLGVIAPAAEPVAVVITELMANACYYSAGTVGVQVQIHEVPTGAVVVIDDAGVGIHPDDLAQAQRSLSGREPLRLAALGDPPRLGMAIIGRLLSEHPLKVSFGVSGYQGTRATVHIPRELLVDMDEEALPLAAATPQPAVRPEPPARTGPGHNPLPRRRRQAPDPAVAPASADAAGPPREPRVARPDRTPEEARRLYGGLPRRVREGEADDPTTGPTGEA